MFTGPPPDMTMAGSVVKTTCANPQPPLTKARRPVWVRLSGLRSSAIVRPCFPSQSMSDAPRARVASYMLMELLLMATGTVKWFNAQKGYGFIQPENGGADVFVPISAVERAGVDNFREGQKLSYELEQGQRGRVSAVNLRAV